DHHRDQHRDKHQRNEKHLLTLHVERVSFRCSQHTTAAPRSWRLAWDTRHIRCAGSTPSRMAIASGYSGRGNESMSLSSAKSRSVIPPAAWVISRIVSRL